MVTPELMTTGMPPPLESFVPHQNQKGKVQFLTVFTVSLRDAEVIRRVPGKGDPAGFGYCSSL